MSNYSSNFPTQRPSLNLVFNGGSDQLDSRISFSRADSTPSNVHYWSNEKSLNSENLLRYSNPNNALWVESQNATIITNSVSSPDGSNTASKITEDSTAGVQHRTYISQTVESGKTFTYVGYLKANGRTIAQLSTTGAGASAGVEFNLTGSGTATTRSGSPSNASITQIGTDWYKCSFQVSSTSSALLYTQIVMCDAANSTVYDGDGTSGVYAWGFNLSTTGQLVTDATSGQISRSYLPLLKTAAADAPRFEYATDGQSEGLLIEQQKSNLALNSNDFTNATWNKQRVTVTPSAAIGPDGQLSASLLAETTDTTTIHFLLPVSAIASGYSAGTNKVTHSIYAKYAGKNLRIVDGYSTVNGATIFDLQNGTVVSGGGVMQSCGNGWWRCSIQPTVDHVTGNVLPYIQLVDGTTWPNASDAGDGYSGILLFGLQTEQQSMSSYITTGSSTATRSADSCSVDLNGILADGQDVTLYAEGDFGDPAIKNSNRFAVALQENSNSYIILYNGGSNSGSGYVRDGGTDQAYFPSGVTAGAFKSAIAAKNNSFKYAVNGTSSTEDTAGTVPEYTTLRVGGFSSSGSELDGHVKRVSVYGQSLSSTELAALTS